MQRPLMSEWCTTTPFTSVLPAAAKKLPAPPSGRGREKIHGSPRPAAAKKSTVLPAPRPRPRPRKETHGSLCPAAAAALESTVLPQSQLRNHPRFSPPRPQDAKKTHGSHRPAAAEKSTVHREKIHGFHLGRSAGIAEPTLADRDFRWRPYRVEYTGSLLTSEVKRHRAWLVLGWGTAWEHPQVLPAFLHSSPAAARGRASRGRGKTVGCFAASTAGQ